jgi:hypothetical protein
MILLQYHLLYNSNKIYQHESLYAPLEGTLNQSFDLIYLWTLFYRRCD